MSYHVCQRNIEEHASSKGKDDIWSKIIAHQDAKRVGRSGGACSFPSQLLPPQPPLCPLVEGAFNSAVTAAEEQD